MTEDLHALAYAYAIGALTDAEAQEFEQHLAECSSCTSGVFEAREVAAALSSLVPAEPPARLRATVLAEIAQTPQQALPSMPTAPSFTVVKQSSPDGRPGRHLGSVAEEQPREVAPVTRLRQRRWTATLLAAASVLAAVGFGGWAYEASREDDTNQVATDPAQQLAQEQRDELTDLLAADDVRTVSGRFPQTDNTGTVVVSEKRQQAMFVASGLPALPDDEVYEAWTIDGDATPAGTFTSDGTRAITTLSDPQQALSADAFAITIEPAGGSEQPTSDAIFTVVLPQR